MGEIVSDDVYVVAGTKSWHRRAFDDQLSKLPGHWHFVAGRAELTAERLAEWRPRYVFFLHWSWLVPAAIVEGYECVCFHMTDVPYGRGGSPLQNLIARGHRQTMLTALRMVPDLDAGPVYLKAPLSLEGTAEEIYLRATELSVEMIAHLVRDHPVPVPQAGEVVTFARRRPEQSRLPETASLAAAHDAIRMVDAEGYPRAFLEYGGLRFEFSRAIRYADRLVADVTITEAKGDGA